MVQRGVSAEMKNITGQQKGPWGILHDGFLGLTVSHCNKRTVNLVGEKYSGLVNPVSYMVDWG